MLQDEMAIEKQRLHFRQEVVIAVQVRPAGLYHSHPWVGEVVDGLLQKIHRWNEIGIKDGNKLACRRVEAFRQCPRLEPFSIRTVVILDGEP